MPKVKAYATMETDLEWQGNIPDDVPPEDYWRWVKDHVDGGDFTDSGFGDWVWSTHVDLIEEGEVE